jgi:hypothetical protein
VSAFKDDLQPRARTFQDLAHTAGQLGWTGIGHMGFSYAWDGIARAGTTIASFIPRIGGGSGAAAVDGAPAAAPSGGTR